MTPSELKHYYETHQENGKYFTRNNMKFGGDTMANYLVIEHNACWELARKKIIKNGLKNSHYFSKIDYRESSSVANFEIDKIAATELKCFIVNKREDLDTIKHGDVMTMAAFYIRDNCSKDTELGMIFNLETIAYTCELLGVKL